MNRPTKNTKPRTIDTRSEHTTWRKFFRCRSNLHEHEAVVLGQKTTKAAILQRPCPFYCQGPVIHSFLLVMFGLLHAADGVVTYFGLRFTNVDEANPVLVYAADNFGLGLSIFFLKLACLAVVAFLFSQRRRIKSCWSTAVLTSAVYFYCWVVGNNVLLITVT